MIMQYPDTLKLVQLESQHPEYIELAPALKEIDLLTAGGHRLKNQIKQFLPQRPGEDEALYETRLGKFTYNPILASAINQQASKLTNSTVHISGIEANSTFWNSFREDTNGKGRKEQDFIAHLYRDLVKYKRIYLHVDKPKSPFQPKNRAQEQYLGLRPYITTYSALQVINWSESKHLDWIKVRQLSVDTADPFRAPLTKATWTLIDSKMVAQYEAYVKLDKLGRIVATVNEKGEELEYGEDAKVFLMSQVQHNLGMIPVIKVELPDDLWTCDQASAKALEHLRLDCGKYDLLTMAYFQRTYRRVQTPDADLTQSHVGEAEPLSTGLQHVLELEQFNWSEPQGHILVHLFTALEQIESQVRDLVCMGGTSAAANKDTLQQSGISKELDFVNESELLEQYGQIIANAYQTALQLVAKAQGMSSDTISVTGLSDYEVDTLDSVTAKLTSLSNIDLEGLKTKLPPILYKLVYQKICSLLIGNLSAEQEGNIAQEIETLLAA